MKKKLAVLMVGTMAAITILGGCGNANNGDTASGYTETEEDEEEVIPADQILASAGYDATQYVTLPDDYMHLTIELSYNYSITDAEVQEYIEEEILANYPAYVETDKTTVEEGDTVDIDYVGLLDGEEFDGGTADDQKLTIGSGDFIDGFEDGLIGYDVGSTVELNLTFPEEYGSEGLQGRDVVFEVTINGIGENVVLSFDDMTDDYVEELYGSYGLTTVDDLVAAERETLESTSENLKQYEIDTLVEEKLIDGSVVEIPDGLVDERTEEFLDGIREAAEEYGMTYEEYVTSSGEYEDTESYEEEVRETMEEYIIQELVLEAIVADQQISVVRSEFDDFVNQYVANLGSYYGWESAEDFYDYYGGEDAAIINYAELLALTAVEEGATIIEPELVVEEEPADEQTEEETEEEPAEDAEADSE